ncbi:MAG: CDP-diacylglycerol--serine O-phosphatidyltransferase [Pseudomonadota bacterium]
MNQRFARRYKGRRGPKIDTLKKGVYILPNFLTSLSLFFGFYSIVTTMQGDFLKASWAIIIAALFDGLDGRIARMTHTTTRFGVEYDSLSDLVAFGVAPAALAYGWVLNQYGRWGWVAAFLYVACGAIRLARFNIQTTTVKGNFFTGLPIPAAAGMVTATAIFCFHFDIADKKLLSIFFILTIYILAFLMVSTIRFQSFKQLDLKSRQPFNSVVLAILLIYIVASEPQVMLFVMTLTYMLSGPITYLNYLIKKKKMKEKEQEFKIIHTEDKDAIEKTIP